MKVLMQQDRYRGSVNSRWHRPLRSLEAGGAGRRRRRRSRRRRKPGAVFDVIGG